MPERCSHCGAVAGQDHMCVGLAGQRVLENARLRRDLDLAWAESGFAETAPQTTCPVDRLEEFVVRAAEMEQTRAALIAAGVEGAEHGRPHVAVSGMVTTCRASLYEERAVNLAARASLAHVALLSHRARKLFKRIKAEVTGVAEHEATGEVGALLADAAMPGMGDESLVVYLLRSAWEAALGWERTAMPDRPPASQVLENLRQLALSPLSQGDRALLGRLLATLVNRCADVVEGAPTRTAAAEDLRLLAGKPDDLVKTTCDQEAGV